MARSVRKPRRSRLASVEGGVSRGDQSRPPPRFSHLNVASGPTIRCETGRMPLRLPDRVSTAEGPRRASVLAMADESAYCPRSRWVQEPAISDGKVAYQATSNTGDDRRHLRRRASRAFAFGLRPDGVPGLLRSTGLAAGAEQETHAPTAGGSARRPDHDQRLRCSRRAAARACDGELRLRVAPRQVAGG